jgi:SRSO17 transposase
MRFDEKAHRYATHGVTSLTYALETLAKGDAVLVIDDTGFLKQGKASCGVGR